MTRLILPWLLGSVPGATSVILGDRPTISLMEARTRFRMPSIAEIVSDEPGHDRIEIDYGKRTAGLAVKEHVIDFRIVMRDAQRKFAPLV